MIKIKLDTRGAMADINKIAKEVEDGAFVALVDFVNNVRNDAISKAPADETGLRRSINAVYPKKGVNMEASVVVTANYAAFQEFGTRKFAAQYVATLPQDWQKYAATFKGQSGGNFAQFLKSIMGWVKRKGIPTEAAYPIALKILREGIRPKKFLYTAVKDNTPGLIDDFKKLIK